MRGESLTQPLQKTCAYTFTVPNPPCPSQRRAHDDDGSLLAEHLRLEAIRHRRRHAAVHTADNSAELAPNAVAETSEPTGEAAAVASEDEEFEDGTMVLAASGNGLVVWGGMIELGGKRVITRASFMRISDRRLLLSVVLGPLRSGNF